MTINSVAINEQLINGEVTVGINSDDNIGFNGFGLSNANIVTSNVSEYSAPTRLLTKQPIPGDDGQIIEFDRFPEKIIKIDGTVFGSTAADLDNRIDEMKKFLSVGQRTLVVSQIGAILGQAGGHVRYYTATIVKPERLFAKKSGQDITRAPFEAWFVCVDPFGRDQAREVSSLFDQTNASVITEIYNDGTYKTPPIFYLTFSAASSVSKVNITNNTTGEEIEVTESINAGSILEINAEDKIVKIDGVEKDFDGFFWKLATGTNNVTITVTSTSHTYSITAKHYNRYL